MEHTLYGTCVFNYLCFSCVVQIKARNWKQTLESILVIPITGRYFHYDPLGLSGGHPGNLQPALSLNLLMTQTVIQEPAPHILVVLVVMMNEE